MFSTAFPNSFAALSAGPNSAAETSTKAALQQAAAAITRALENMLAA
jgi:hypothetical protein